MATHTDPQAESAGTLNCRYASLCSGCAWIERPPERQREDRLQALREAWSKAGVTAPLPPLHYVGIASGGLRDRTDLIIDRRTGAYRLGLFGRDRHDILDLDTCPQLSPALDAFLREFRAIQLPVKRGSVRLRVSPGGERGVWLDLANLDVKNLLEEQTTLRALMAIARVEIGQRRKTLIDQEGRLRLAEPTLLPWFETYLGGELRATPLFTVIGGFTQPGFRANRSLVAETLRLGAAAAGDRPLARVAEFGAGSGNFTLPLAAGMAAHVDAYEVDALACRGLRLGAEAAGLSERIFVHEGDFQVATRRADFSAVDMIVADPPRSGLMAFLEPLAEVAPDSRPKLFLYVSCFADSFALDSRRLVELGYRPSYVSVLEQFPQSPHFEIAAAFTRD